jgi:transmembrane sensor
MSSDSRPDPDLVARSAAEWLARRDRGLTPAEQDAFTQWLAADPAHPAALRQHAAAFERMMTLYEWQPGQSPEPNENLFVPPARHRWWLAVAGLAAAASLVVGVALTWRGAAPTEPAVVAKTYLRVNERHALPDGSLVELNEGARIALRFSAGERRVHLTGEGHFTVTPDAARPFVVEAGGATVRAVGTAFNVRLGLEAVDVLVTEGSVRVESPRGAADADAVPAALVEARHRAVISLSPAAAPAVTPVQAAEIAEALAWQMPRLQFFDTPLGEAIAEFNARNPVQLVLGEADLRNLAIGGTFAVDNVEGFVRLLELTCDLRSERRGREIVLTRGP